MDDLQNNTVYGIFEFWLKSDNGTTFWKLDKNNFIKVFRSDKKW